MSKPQFVLEEALESYLGQLAMPFVDRAKIADSIVDLNTGILIGLRAGRLWLRYYDRKRNKTFASATNVNYCPMCECELRKELK